MSNNAEDLVARAKALYTKDFTRDSTGEIRALLEQALANAAELSPQASAETRALLAGVVICSYLNRWDHDKAQLAEAEQRIEEALQIAPGTALAHFAKGFLHRAQDQHELALTAFREALEYNPRFPGAHAQTGATLIHLGRPQEALPHIEKAIALIDPDSPLRGMFYWIMGRAQFFLARYGDALSWLDQSIALQKDLWYTRLFLVSACALTGKAREAERGLKEFNDLFPNYTIARLVEIEPPNRNLLVVIGRRNLHTGLRLAGMPEG
jgi:adenylate cyclase